MCLALLATSAQTGEEESSDFTKTPYPKIAMMWAPIRGDRSLESIAKHDLAMLGSGGLRLSYNREPRGLSDGFTSESVEAAKQKVQQLRQLNPDILVFADLLFYEWGENWLPEDHTWWLRINGERQQFWPGTYRMDWNNPDYRRHVVNWTVAVKETGVDGIFYDNIRNEPEPWVAFLTEVRKAVGDDFLIYSSRIS